MENNINMENVKNEVNEETKKEDVITPKGRLIGKFKKVEKEEVEKILLKKDKADNVKNTWSDIYNDVFKFCIPQRYKEKKINGVYSGTDGKLFNSVGQQSTIAFVNRIQQMLCPPDSDWIKMTTGNAFKKVYDEKQLKQINEQLTYISDVLNNIKATSNFDIAISEFFFDLVAGTSCLLVQAKNKYQPIIFKTIPFADYSISEGQDGDIDGVFREFEVKKDEIEYIWDDINKNVLNDILKDIQDDDGAVINLIETTTKNYKTNKWDYLVIHKENKKVLVSRQYLNNPFIILRWNKGSSDWYGTGVGMIARNDLATYNEMMKNIMLAMQFSLPSFLADQSDPFRKNFQPRPLAVNYVKYENGKPLVTQLDYNPRYDLTQLNKQEMAMDINKMMMAGQIPSISKEMTASEVNELVSQEAIQYTSVFGRLVQDFLFKIPKIMLELLQNAFDVLQDINIDEIDQYIYKVQIDTPFSQRLHQQQNSNTINNIISLLQLDPSGSLLKRYVKLDNALLDYLRVGGMREEYINDLETINKNDLMAQQQAQQMQQQQMQQAIDLNGITQQQKAMANNINKGE